MSQKNDHINPLDPTGMLKNVRDASLDAWSKMMIQLVHTDAYAQATGAMLDTWLATSTPFRKALESTMAQVLTNLNMPAMTMVFKVSNAAWLDQMKSGDKIRFMAENVNGAITVVHFEPAK